MLKEKLGPNPILQLTRFSVFFALSFWLLSNAPSTPLRVAGFAVLYPILLGFTLPQTFLYLLSGWFFSTAGALTLSVLCTLFWDSACFLFTRRFKLAAVLRLRKKHEKSYWFVHEPILGSFQWGFRNRLIPIIPSDDFTLGAGGSKASFWPYLAGSVLGRFPLIFFAVNFGRTVFLALQNPAEPAWPTIAAWGIPLALLSFTPVFYRHMESWGSEQ